MYKNYFIRFIVIIAMFPLSWSCKTSGQWKGQGEIAKVNTETVPVQRQCKEVTNLGNGIYASNNFDGARLNGISLRKDTLTALITPENTPVNMSPWYSFKLWSDSEKDIVLKLTYLDGTRHRYYPKISKDGKNWKSLDSAYFKLNNKVIDEKEVGVSATLDLTLSKDTLWVSAQEKIISSDVNEWSEKLEANSFIEKIKIGESKEGRPIHSLKIGKSDDKAMILVLSRQHPPEVTGFLAMQAFVETIASDSETAKNFRKKYNTYVVPLANPDGVDNGNWRHGMGGVDLNRDWEDFNQPETRAIRDFMKKKVAESGGKLYFFVDFHSTWEDIYYTIDPGQEGNMPGLVPELISSTGKELKNYEPNVRPSPGTGKRVTSTSYFFYNFGAEALTYEIGDNTPRDFVRRKGELTAEKLMKLMNKESLR